VAPLCWSTLYNFPPETRVTCPQELEEVVEVVDGLERESAAVVSEDAEVHLEAPVVDLVLVLGAQVTDRAQVGAAHLHVPRQQSTGKHGARATRRYMPPPTAVRRWQKSRRISVRPRTGPQPAVRTFLLAGGG